MSTLVVELYDALKEAGASEEKARAAAQTLAAHDARSDRFEAILPTLATKTDILALKSDIAEAKADILKWMLPFLAGQLLAMLALVAKAYLPG